MRKKNANENNKTTSEDAEWSDFYDDESLVFSDDDNDEQPKPKDNNNNTSTTRKKFFRPYASMAAHQMQKVRAQKQDPNYKNRENFSILTTIVDNVILPERFKRMAEIKTAQEIMIKVYRMIGWVVLFAGVATLSFYVCVLSYHHIFDSDLMYPLRARTHVRPFPEQSV